MNEDADKRVIKKQIPAPFSLQCVSSQH